MPRGIEAEKYCHHSHQLLPDPRPPSPAPKPSQHQPSSLQEKKPAAIGVYNARQSLRRAQTVRFPGLNCVAFLGGTHAHRHLNKNSREDSATRSVFSAFHERIQLSLTSDRPGSPASYGCDNASTVAQPQPEQPQSTNQW